MRRNGVSGSPPISNSSGMPYRVFRALRVMRGLSVRLDSAGERPEMEKWPTTRLPHMWRRLSLGLEGSQPSGQGTLPSVALVWRPLRRAQTHETRGFRVAGSMPPAFHLDIGGPRFGQILKERGIASQLMLGSRHSSSKPAALQDSLLMLSLPKKRPAYHL